MTKIKIRKYKKIGFLNTIMRFNYSMLQHQFYMYKLTCCYINLPQQL